MVSFNVAAGVQMPRAIRGGSLHHTHTQRERERERERILATWPVYYIVLHVCAINNHIYVGILVSHHAWPSYHRHLSSYPLKNARFSQLWSFILRLINLVNRKSRLSCPEYIRLYKTKYEQLLLYYLHVTSHIHIRMYVHTYMCVVCVCVCACVHVRVCVCAFAVKVWLNQMIEG